MHTKGLVASLWLSLPASPLLGPHPLFSPCLRGRPPPRGGQYWHGLSSSHYFQLIGAILLPLYLCLVVRKKRERKAEEREGGASLTSGSDKVTVA